VRILIGHIRGQSFNLALQSFDALQIRDMAGREGAYDLQNTAMFLAKIFIVLRVEADHGDHLVIADDRNGDLAFEQFAQRAVEPARSATPGPPVPTILGCLVCAT